MKYSNGDEYTGEFRNGKRDGKGELVSSSGHKYVGTFKDDMRHGEGDDHIPERYLIYRAASKRGKLQGQGKTTFFDGTVYVGEYSNGKFDGKGQDDATQKRHLRGRLQRRKARWAGGVEGRLGQQLFRELQEQP